MAMGHACTPAPQLAEGRKPSASQPRLHGQRASLLDLEESAITRGGRAMGASFELRVSSSFGFRGLGVRVIIGFGFAGFRV